MQLELSQRQSRSPTKPRYLDGGLPTVDSEATTVFPHTLLSVPDQEQVSCSTVQWRNLMLISFDADAKSRACHIFSSMGTYYSHRHIEAVTSTIANANRQRPASENAIQSLLKNVECVEDICAICLASMEITAMPCDHRYHSDCLLYWLKTADTCPCCRKKLREDGGLE